MEIQVTNYLKKLNNVMHKRFSNIYNSVMDNRLCRWSIEINSAEIVSPVDDINAKQCQVQVLVSTSRRPAELMNSL